MEPVEGNLEPVAKKVTQNEPLFTLTEDCLIMHGTVSNETTLVSEVAIIIDKEDIIIAPGQEKTPLSVLNDDMCEELAFPYLF